MASINATTASGPSSSTVSSASSPRTPTDFKPGFAFQPEFVPQSVVPSLSASSYCAARNRTSIKYHSASSFTFDPASAPVAYQVLGTATHHVATHTDMSTAHLGPVANAIGSPPISSRLHHDKAYQPQWWDTTGSAMARVPLDPSIVDHTPHIFDAALSGSLDRMTGDSFGLIPEMFKNQNQYFIPPEGGQMPSWPDIPCVHITHT